jgi:hypothetical protein
MRFGRRRSRSPKGEPAGWGGRIKPWSPSSHLGRRSKNGYPTTNRISTGSTVPGSHPIPILKASTKLMHGSPRKSNCTTAERWFSNPPDKKEAHPPKKRRQSPPKEILAKRSGELRSRQLNMTVKPRKGHRDTAVASRFSSLLTADSALFTSSAPFFPATLFSPASGPVTGSFNGLHRESKFLAIICEEAAPPRMIREIYLVSDSMRQHSKTATLAIIRTAI